jgi:hypothetical protein
LGVEFYFHYRLAELLIATHLHGTAALENTSALSAVSPTTSTTGIGALSPTTPITTTTTASTTRFPASVSTTNLAGINSGGAIHQRQQSSPTDSTRLYPTPFLLHRRQYRLFHSLASSRQLHGPSPTYARCFPHGTLSHTSFLPRHSSASS